MKTKAAKAPKTIPTAAEQLELRPGQSLELLQELHILTREGRINQGPALPAGRRLLRR